MKVSQIGIYIDEDAMDSDLVAALRSRGVTVITAMDAGLAGKSDDDQLAFAAEQGCVLYTFNVSDFYRLPHGLGRRWARTWRNDPGAAAAVLGRRAVAPHLASSRGHHHCEDAEPGRVPGELGLTEGAPVPNQRDFHATAIILDLQ